MKQPSISQTEDAPNCDITPLKRLALYNEFKTIAARPERFGFRRQDFTTRHLPKAALQPALRRIYVGLRNLWEPNVKDPGAQLNTQLWLFLAVTNPDELISYAYSIGERAIGTPYPRDETFQETGGLYEAMAAANERNYKPSSRVQPLLTLLQNRVRNDVSHHHPIRPGDLRARITILQQEERKATFGAASVSALLAYTAAADVRPVHQDIGLIGPIGDRPSSKMSARELREGIDGIITATYREYQRHREQ